MIQQEYPTHHSKTSTSSNTSQTVGTTTHPPVLQSPHSTQQDKPSQQTQIVQGLPPPQRVHPTLKGVHVDPELKDHSGPPIQSDCSSTSHRADELHIINLLSPRKKKKEPAILGNDEPSSKEEVHDTKMQELSHLNHNTVTSAKDPLIGKEGLPNYEQEASSSPINHKGALNTDTLAPGLHLEATATENHSSDQSNTPSKQEPNQSIHSKDIGPSGDLKQTSQLDLPPQDNPLPVINKNDSPIVDTIQPRAKYCKRKIDNVPPQLPQQVSARRIAAESKKLLAQNPMIKIRSYFAAAVDFIRRRNGQCDNGSPHHLVDIDCTKVFRICGQSYTQE
ncbi:uncharacterized protein MELLADRAFT_61976 [Melampsora larici-populina 98AG31]|uniref:Uncharacterized protein n=1 Tax=Melampsora larici-populina (strain 98AG31 / pathotype 3-4-7) TaxID=747676 RepID=F4RHI4_MELLP|nr:uncharacterized protein MELLADRAFT_61976 [Melampsora larici-populina 98AG31]EGG08353.1 hypothetical protein MELLADRAFT_61976 [Melampsora larici-populina 98AG31]